MAETENPPESMPSPPPQAGAAGAGNDWRASLPAEVRAAPIITRHATVEALAKSVIEQDAMMQRGIWLPTAERGTEAHTAAMDKVYTTLGRPAKAEDYTLTAPEGRTMDPDGLARFQRAFHAAGLTQTQAQAVVSEYWRTVEYAEGVHATRAAAADQAGQQALATAFGPSSEALQDEARSFFDHFGETAFGGKAGELAWQQLHEARLPDGRRLSQSPNLIAAFAEATKHLGVVVTLPAGTTEALQARQRELLTLRHSPQGLDEAGFEELQAVNRRLLTDAGRNRSRRP